MIVQAEATLAPDPQLPRAVGGVRASAIVLIGVAALNIGNYTFHLICARYLGPTKYADVATLITVASLISLPIAAVQIWVSRRVAQYRALGDDEGIDAFIWDTGRYSIVVAIVLTALLVALSWPLAHALHISSTFAMALTALTALPAVITPVSWGLAQGLERFGVVAAAYAVGPLVRIVLVLVAFGLGMEVGGAMLATLLSMLVAVIAPLIWLKERIRRPVANSTPVLNARDAATSLFPVLVGLLAITALSSADVVAARIDLPGHVAGLYGSASLVGRIALYIPAAIITVLLPRVAARTASRQDSLDILARSAAATFGICVFITVCFATIGRPAMREAFGADYARAGSWLWLFGIAMTGFAILNVLFIYHLGREQTFMSWLLLGGAAVQLVAFVGFHATPHQLVYDDIAIAIGLLIAHELMTRGLLIRAFVSRPKTRAAY